MRKLSLMLLLPLACILVAIAQDEPIKAKVPDEVTEGSIARSAARILERVHYSQLKFDDELSAKFLDNYFQTLDPQRLHFLQTDVDEFEKYRHTLDDLTLRSGDTKPAHEIFARFMQRLDQRVGHVTDLLKTETFEFTGNDRYTPDRKELPRPADLAEAKELWKQHLRYEYLQEKLLLRQKEDKRKQDLAEGKLDKTGKPDEKKSADKPLTLKTPQEEIFETLTNRYTRLQKNLAELTKDEVFELYMSSMTHLFDPHSDYMGRAQAENFAISMKLSLFGIGAVLTSEDGYCKIKDLVPGPAMRSKQMKPGDRIVAVAQPGKKPVDCVGMKLNKVVEMIRGPKGSEVHLTIIPVDAGDSSERKIVTLVRDEIKLEDQEAKAKIIDMPTSPGKTVRIGVIDLPSFYGDMESRKNDHKSTSADVARLLKKLNAEKINGLVLDLRRNGGGALNEAIKLTGLFIKKGPVVQTKEPSGKIVVDADTDSSVLYDGPMVVLTSRFSASASEILAGALQDYGRALIVGDSSTHGKGTVQQLLGLRGILDDNRLPYGYDPGSLKFTIRKFYRASGSSTQLRGVTPDIILPSVNNYAEVGESALDNPLEWDDVSTAKIEKIGRVEPYLPDLKKRSADRIAKDTDFSYIRDDIERFKKMLMDKSVSLNEEQRYKELQELKLAADTRKKEREGRKNGDKLYEITLKDVDVPGLPKPAPKTNETVLAESSAVTAEIVGEEHENGPAVDATLEETKRILADYIQLLTKDNPNVTLVK